MPLRSLISGPLETISQYYKNKRLILVHPASRYHNLLVSALLQDAPCPVFYHSLNNTDVNLSLFLHGVFGSLTYQRPGFGLETRLMIDQVEAASRPELVTAFANDLSGLHTDDYILILDEFDRAEGVPSLLNFMEQLIPKLADHCHLLLNGRSMPRLPWVRWVANQEALVVGDQFSQVQPVYNEEAPNIEIQAFGPGLVMLDGQPIEWEGVLPKLLFFYALDRGSFSRDDVCSHFWGDLAFDQAVNVFHVTKRRLHRIMGFDVITHRKRQYHFTKEVNLSYDVLDFVRSINRARSSPSDEAITLLKKAIGSYRGHYLQGNDEAWIAELRQALQANYIEALRGLAESHQGAGEYAEALGLYLQIASEDPLDGEAHEEILRLYGELGRWNDVQRYYDRIMAHDEASDGPFIESFEHVFEYLMQQVR